MRLQAAVAATQVVFGRLFVFVHPSSLTFCRVLGGQGAHAALVSRSSLLGVPERCDRDLACQLA